MKLKYKNYWKNKQKLKTKHYYQNRRNNQKLNNSKRLLYIRSKQVCERRTGGTGTTKKRKYQYK